MIEIMNLKEVKPSEPYDFYVDRRSPVGNPFPLVGESSRDNVCDAYAEHFNRMVEHGNHEFKSALATMKKYLEVHGRLRLFCWCAPKRCHAETIKQWLENN